MKKLFLFFFLVLITHIDNTAQEEPTAAPQIKTFSTNPDQLGALANSVNLFSGDVALPLNLVSLPGRNGLDVNVSIAYSSAGIHKSVGTWNLEAPTGILGLGWSMDYPKIIVDNKNTGARDDDEFYLVEGGSTNRLVRTGGDNTAKVYETKNYQFWIITYYPATEKWEIIKENGVKYIYGDTDNHSTAVQYLIKWGNWIGNSSLVDGQQRQAMVWNLAEVVDTWGNNVEYEYDNVEKKVGNGLYHTEASYLKKISDTFDRTIEFFYDVKEPNEYMEPHTEINEPDAYQERYETKFLDYMEIKNKDNTLLGKTIFEYDPTKIIDNSSTDKAKRLLTAIEQENVAEHSLPNIKFTYLTSGNKGALSTVTTPAGGVITYNYELQTIGHSNWTKVIDPPEVGYSKPLAWNANDYVVVTWRNGSTIKVCVYEWIGEWIGSVIKTITDVPENDDKQRIQVSLQDNFFALTHDKYTSIPVIGYQKDTKLFVFSKNETENGKWNTVESSYTHLSNTKSLTQLVTGNSFAVITLTGENSTVLGYQTKNAVWEEKIFYSEFWDDKIEQYIFLSATNNYLWIHNTKPNPDDLEFHYLDELNIWHSQDVSINRDVSPVAYWHSNNSASMALLYGGDEQYWYWDENYTTFNKINYAGVDDDSKVYMFSTGVVGVVDVDNPYIGTAFAYYGSNVLSLENMLPHTFSYYSTHSFGSDFVLKKVGTASETGHIWKIFSYDPNSISWSSENLTSSLSNPSLLAGNNFYAFGNKVYFKQTNGNYTLSTFTLPISGTENFSGGQNFLRHNYTEGTLLMGSKLFLFKNGEVLNTSVDISIAASDNKLTTSNTIVGHSGSLENSSQIILYRIYDENKIVFNSFYAVNCLTFNDGYETKSTSYDYFPSYGTIDPSGAVVKYNKVRTRNGTSDGNEAVHPFGYTDTYFYNGLEPSNLENSILGDEDDYTNGFTNYKLLTGLPYLVKVFEDGDDANPVSQKKNYWNIYTKDINSEIGYYSRLKNSVETIDGLVYETTFNYDSQSGLVSGKTVNNFGSNGLESLMEVYKYGYSEYSELESKNILTPIIQKKTFTDNTCTSVTATTWTDSWPNTSITQMAPNKSYINSISGNVDFTEWTGGTPNANWLKTSEIIILDDFGNVIETSDIDEIHSVIKYGFVSGIPVASITNSTDSESKIELCQEYRSTSWGNLAPNFNEYQNGSGGTVSYSMYDSEAYRGRAQKIVAVGVTGSGGVNVNMGTLNSNRNYIIEFDVKVISGEMEVLSYSTGKGYTSQDYIGTLPSWGHFSYLWDMGGNGSNSQIWFRSKYNTSGSSATFYIDNVRIYPEDAFVVSSNYDPTYLDVVCATNAQGVNTFFEYDEFRRQVQIRNHEEEILSQTNYYLSRENHTDFSTSYPNYIESIVPTLGGISRTYTDGFGKTRQTQTKESSSDIMISGVVYDKLGRANKTTKPTKRNIGFGYLTNFAKNLPTSGTMEDVQIWNNDYYPYSETEYEDSPLGRIIEYGLPGSTFIVGSGHTSKMSYSTNASEFSGYTGGQYSLTTSIDPNGTQSYLLKDKAGNTMAEKADPLGISATTTYEYDDYHNLIHIYPPNYHNPPSGTANDFKIDMTYDHLGRLKTRYSKDAGEVKYIYDKAGRTRFMMDANGEALTTDNLLYWKYDYLGRTIEEGYIVQNWSESTLQSNAENQNWPTTPSTWRKKYTYGDISNQYNYGQLVKVEVNNDGSSDTEVEETYNYEIDGNVKDKGIRIVDYNNIEKTISYEYDILGNVARVSYMPIDLLIENETISGEAYYEAADEVSVGMNFSVNSGGSLTLKAGNLIHLLPGFSVNLGGTLTTLLGGEGSADVEETQVEYVYDEMGRIKQIGTSSDEDFFASYIYGINGEMTEEKLHNSAVTRTYTYENPGWLKQIDDPFIKETLSYTSGGYGGAGYYNGNIAKAAYDLKWSGNPGDYNVLYKYDKLNRLLVADNSASSNYDVGVGNEISYDANGNIKDLRRGTITRNYTYYSGTNKVLNIDGSGTDYAYDKNGNVTTSVNKGITNLSYDPFINLATSINNGDLTNFTYGGSSQRVIKSDNYTTTAYVHGMSDFPLMEKFDDGSSEITKLYVYGPTGLIAVNDDEGWFFLLKDHLGSTRVVLNESNNWVSNYDYLPFGNIMRNTVNTEIPYQFTGQEYDTELSLHNFRARLYDSDLGMFYAVDPAGQGFSPYGFCGNNPIIYIDKDGNWFLLDDIASFVIGGTINLLSNLGNIDNFGEGFAAFSAGGVQGLATIYGGPAGYYASAALVGATNSAISQMNSWSDFGNINWGQVGINAGASVAGAFVGAQFAPVGSAIGNWTSNALNISSPVISNAISRGVAGSIGGGLTGFTLGYAFSRGNLDQALESGVNGFKSGFATSAIGGAIDGYRYANANKISPWTGEKTHSHHSNPKFIGGDKNQQLTEISGSRHLKLHNEMNSYLRNQTNEFGQHMQPIKGNSGIVIRQNFTSFQLRGAMDGFYLRNFYKYPRTALDYFLYTR